jgi:hypothetical protein
MSLFAVLMSGLRVLFGALSMFFALGMIALAVVFSGGTVCLSCIFVMFGGLVVFVSRHCKPRWWVIASQRGANSRWRVTFP